MDLYTLLQILALVAVILWYASRLNTEYAFRRALAYFDIPPDEYSRLKENGNTHAVLVGNFMLAGMKKRAKDGIALVNGLKGEEQYWSAFRQRLQLVLDVPPFDVGRALSLKLFEIESPPRAPVPAQMAEFIKKWREYLHECERLLPVLVRDKRMGCSFVVMPVSP